MCRCEFGSGLRTCHCPACHRTFTSVTGFDRHQRLTQSGVTCLDPSGMRRSGGDPVFILNEHGHWAQFDPREHYQRAAGDTAGRVMPLESVGAGRRAVLRGSGSTK